MTDEHSQRPSGLEDAWSLGQTCHQTLAIIGCDRDQAAAERMLELARDPDITSDDFRTVQNATPTEGVGCGSLGGLLIHHYKTDERGVVTDANLVVDQHLCADDAKIKIAATDLIRV